MATHSLLQPYQPSAEDPFDAVKAAHLLNRAGFGGTPAEVEKVLKLGPEGAVDWLMDFPDAGAEEQSEMDVPDLSKVEGLPAGNFRQLRKLFKGKDKEQRKALRQKFMKANQQAQLQTVAWWLNRMCYGPHPLQEKLTFFWHGHFTTAFKDQRSAALMWRQNELLRRMAAGNFRDFVHAVSKDPAMLDYLNNQQNKKGKPNENYARELMELFTLGIGNYTEQDIKEAARAFTGWTHEADEFVFRPRQHDFDRKTFFGKSGDFNGDEIIEIILAHQACPKYISGKVFGFFAYEDMDPGLNDALAKLFYEEAGYELRPLLRTILTSKAFYSPKAIGAQIKSPVQLVCGTVRILGIDVPPVQRLRNSLDAMGQIPMNPPNVKGWPGGRSWVNAATIFARYNTAVQLVGGKGMGVQAKPLLDMSMKGKGADAIVDAWVNRLIQRPIETQKRELLVKALGDKPDAEPNVRKMVQLIVSMPEYQLC